MTKNEIEHMWKVASKNPNHDTNWHDPVVINFAKLVVAHTLSIIDPFKYISCQEAFEAGQSIEREACADIAENWNCNGSPRVGVAAQIRARGNT
jgi:hypothetical protein